MMKMVRATEIVAHKITKQKSIQKELNCEFIWELSLTKRILIVLKLSGKYLSTKINWLKSP